MAKSARSKVKRSFRKAKRDDSVFAVAHAARLQRLSQKLTTIARPTPALKTLAQVEETTEEELVEEPEELDVEPADSMEVDGPRNVSTHGRRLNRRQEWRASKGLSTQRKKGKMNRQGAPAAARHSGKPKRRR